MQLHFARSNHVVGTASIFRIFIQEPANLHNIIQIRFTIKIKKFHVAEYLRYLLGIPHAEMRRSIRPYLFRFKLKRTLRCRSHHLASTFLSRLVIWTPPSTTGQRHSQQRSGRRFTLCIFPCQRALIDDRLLPGSAQH